MRIAALYDIHGNVPALDAVLAEVERAGVDLVVWAATSPPGRCPPRRSSACARSAAAA